MPSLAFYVMSSRLPVGTVINAVAVLVGGSIGLLLRQALPAGMVDIAFQAIGLSTILIAIKMMLKLPDGYMLVFIFSLILGGVIGEAIGLDVWIRNSTTGLRILLGVEDQGFSDGLITAFVLFCIGSMTFVGALQEGLSGNRELLLTKSLLDGVSSIALAATFGMGVLFSVLPMILLQGSITLSAHALRRHLNDDLIDALSAVGGALIMGIAIVVLNLGSIRLNNLLPALLVVLLLTVLYQRYQRHAAARTSTDAALE